VTRTRAMAGGRTAATMPRARIVEKVSPGRKAVVDRPRPPAPPRREARCFYPKGYMDER
jgi:hypothetical protein